MDDMKQLSFGFLIFFAAALLCAQGTDVQFSYNGSGNYYLVERTAFAGMITENTPVL